MVKIDKEKTIDVGVWGCQIKIAYNTGFVFAPRPLFPKYFLPAVNHPLNTQLRATDDFVLVVGIQPVIDFYQNWKENKKSAYDESLKSSYEGHLRTNFAATNKVRFGLPGADSVKITNIWKNWVVAFKESYVPDDLPVWPEWIVERLICILPGSIIIDGYDFLLDMPRSLFSNIFSRKLPSWGNMNEKNKWKDLTKPTLPNILALNAFAHHDIITLP